ncbi:MAG: hypothetical protein IPJ01_10585 [Micavibrio sp.]|nr:hypothetical protein [Micavibrio sp.]
MKNQDNEIKKSIIKAINEHQSEIDRYNEMLKLISGNGKLSELRNSNNKPKPNVKKKKDILTKFPLLNHNYPKETERKEMKKKLPKTKVVKGLKYRQNLAPVNWNKLVLPLLESSKEPMNTTQMVDILFKYKKQKSRKVFTDRIYGAMCYLKNKGLVKSDKINGKTCYSLNDLKISDN